MKYPLITTVQARVRHRAQRRLVTGCALFPRLDGIILQNCSRRHHRTTFLGWTRAESIPSSIIIIVTSLASTTFRRQAGRKTISCFRSLNISSGSPRLYFTYASAEPLCPQSMIQFVLPSTPAFVATMDYSIQNVEAIIRVDCASLLGLRE